MGLIGATWASETSIIGSGWLFGALYAAQAAGPVALLGWVIGGVAVIILALVHAELGGMYPVSGGTARFPHLAFGSVAGISFGFFSWVQAITVAPIECFAVMQYGSYYWHGLFDATANGGKGNVTGLGFVDDGRPDGRSSPRSTSWPCACSPRSTPASPGGRSPSRSSPSSCCCSSSTAATSARSAASSPSAGRPCSRRIPSAGIVFAYLGFEQADQLAGEIKNPQKNLPRAIILAILIGIVIYVMLQVVFIGAMPHSLARPTGWAAASATRTSIAGPFAGLAGWSGSAGWPSSCGSTRSSPRSAPA